MNSARLECASAFSSLKCMLKPEDQLDAILLLTPYFDASAETPVLESLRMR